MTDAEFEQQVNHTLMHHALRSAKHTLRWGLPEEKEREARLIEELLVKMEAQDE